MAGVTAFVLQLSDPVVAIDGPDARRFCNNLFTNNARDLPVGQAQRTAMLDERGRVHGLMDLYCVAEERFLAVLEGMSAESFIERYQLHVVLDDVDLEPLPDHTVLTVQGQAPPDRPPGLHLYRRDRTAMAGFDVVGPAAAIGAFRAGLGLPSGDPALLEHLRLERGKPRWPVDFGERSLAHEMGMRDEFLSFEKGCYLGQETVNRVDVMGQVKRRLSVLIADDVLPPDGAEVRVAEKVVGKVTSTSTRDGTRLALAVLRKPHDAAGTSVTVAWSDGSTTATVAAPAR